LLTGEKGRRLRRRLFSWSIGTYPMQTALRFIEP
jgi:hypothetical protein